MNYKKEYDQYWSNEDRIGESSFNNPLEIVEELKMINSLGTVIDVGCGEGQLVECMLEYKLNAKGLDISDTVINRDKEKIKNNFFSASVLDIPIEDQTIDTVISTDMLEHLNSTDVAKAFKEFYRVSKKNIYLRVAVKPDRDGHWHLTIEDRLWWENKLFESGFRKHTSYYMINDYERLNEDTYQVIIVMEKVPLLALEKYPISLLEETRDLHMDMTRDSGERSDAHMIRYQLASKYINPNSKVLDSACGLGYGSYMLSKNTRLDSIIGIDGSEYAINYANMNFASCDDKLVYKEGFLPNALQNYNDASFNAIVSFETLEHVENPDLLLEEFYRALAPGGRIIVSVPNDWSDDTGEDPNPHHLHVYTWDKLYSQISKLFIVEEAYAQTASRCKVASDNNQWQYRQRELKKIDLTEKIKPDCEWLLMIAMKSPINNNEIYEETIFNNLSKSNHPSLNYKNSYKNPFLQHSMVTYGFRMQNKKELLKICNEVLNDNQYSILEYAAALIVKSYSICESNIKSQNEIEEIIKDINNTLKLLDNNEPEYIRWFVSLSFVNAKLYQKIGFFQEAIESYSLCTKKDIFIFGVHLATKVTEAYFHAGELSATLKNYNNCKRYWQEAIHFGTKLQQASIEDILINIDYPNLFDHGDGIREYTLAWDWIARCANGIHLLERNTNLSEIINSDLQKSWKYQYEKVTNDVFNANSELKEFRQNIFDRTQRLEITERDLVDRTQRLEVAEKELEENRSTLIDRTQRLEVAEKELEENRSTLIDRTQRLEVAEKELEENRSTLIDRTQRLEVAEKELEENRSTLIDRTQRLEVAEKDLVERTETLEKVSDELNETRDELESRTQRLEVAEKELEENRSTLIDRTQRLEVAEKDLVERTETLEKVSDELNETRDELESRTQRLEIAEKDLVERTETLEKVSDELNETRDELESRTQRLEIAEKDLVERTETLEKVSDELNETRDELESRTQRLEIAEKDLVERTETLEKVSDELEKTNAELESRIKRLEKVVILEEELNEYKNSKLIVNGKVIL